MKTKLIVDKVYKCNRYHKVGKLVREYGFDGVELLLIDTPLDDDTIGCNIKDITVATTRDIELASIYNALEFIPANNHGPDGSINRDYHRFYVNGTLTAEQAIDFQTFFRFHPAGYGFYDFKSENNITYWTCNKSCD